MKDIKIAFFSLIFLVSSLMAIDIGKVPSEVTLSGKDGSKIDGTTWSSSMLKNKVHIVFYVDPDKKELNQELTKKLKEKHFDRSKYGSVAIINLKATWMPNILLESILKKKQKEFPDTLYVKDKNKVLVKKWNLADNNSDILVFDKNGVLIYKKFGKLPKSQIKDLITLIEKNL